MIRSLFAFVLEFAKYALGLDEDFAKYKFPLSFLHKVEQKVIILTSN